MKRKSKCIDCATPILNENDSLKRKLQSAIKVIKWYAEVLCADYTGQKARDWLKENKEEIK